MVVSLESWEMEWNHFPNRYPVYILHTALYIIGLLENIFNIHVLTLTLIPKGLTPFDE